MKAAASNILLELESKLIILLYTNNQGLYNKLHGSLKVLQQKFIVWCYCKLLNGHATP